MSTDESVRAHPADDADGEPVTPSGRRGGARRRARRERERPAAGATAATGTVGASPVDGDGTSDARPDRLRYWHRDHPVFTPLAGFFTGVLLVVVVLLLLGAILDLVLGYDVSEHPWVFLVALGVLLALNLALVVMGSTRRFARYMLLGILTTPAVAFAVASLTFYLLLENDG
jgi:hypothetical protein